MHDHGIEPIDLVCINLYPFEKTVRKPGVTFEEAIENIDIGGPSMIRSAAKNHRYVLVVTSPERYEKVISEYQDFADRFPESKFLDEAKDFNNLSQNNIKEIQNEQIKTTTKL